MTFSRDLYCNPTFTVLRTSMGLPEQYGTISTRGRPMSDTFPYSYHVFGLQVNSELELPELSVLENTGTLAGLPVIVRLGAVLPLLGEKDVEAGAYYAEPGQVLYSFPDIGRFRIREGTEIVVDPFPGVEVPALRLFILGICMATLLHQRKLLVLHASAVSVDGCAVLFLGGKGYGKSTIAATLHERGHQVVTDDIAPISLERDGVRMYTGFTQLKLWPEAAQALLGFGHDELPRLYSQVEKRKYRPAGSITQEILPVGAVFVLEFGDDLSIRELRSQEAFGQLLRHSFLFNMMQSTGGRPVHFQQCVELLRRMPLHVLRRPRDLSLLGRIATCVEEHVAGVKPLV
jgi:hypothetical protein